MNGKIAAILLGIMSACTIVEVLDIAEIPQVPPTFNVQVDTTEIKDTILIPIEFEVKVEDGKK